jgi:hypothetical protein
MRRAATATTTTTTATKKTYNFLSFIAACRLRRVEPLCRLTNSALQQLAMCGFYEDLEKGVTCKA